MPKLLLADDSITIQRVIELTFADEDVQVLTAGDGEQAIARIQAERPDIVLADIGMPKRNGYEVAAFVKETPGLSHIPVLLLTGAFEPVDEARARAVGCDGVLVKPFEPQHVIGRVQELLRRGANHDAGASGGSLARAVSDVPRPADRSAPSRGVTGSRVEDAAAAAGADRPPRAADESALDDYFDRLDAAFAGMTGGASARPSDPVRRDGPVLERDLDWFDSPPPALPVDSPEARPAASPHEAAPAADPVPVTFASPPGGAPGWQGPQPPSIEPPDATREIAPQASPPAAASEPAADSGSAIADAFSALLAAEQGEAGAVPVRLGLTGSQPVITEALVDVVASRVVERLGAHASRDLVADIVSRVAERLVREEIDRIRGRQV